MNNDTPDSVRIKALKPGESVLLEGTNGKTIHQRVYQLLGAHRYKCVKEGAGFRITHLEAVL